MKALLSMFALHVLSDFVLQGQLGDLKQKKWWGEQCHKTYWGSFDAQFKMYGKDWISGLAVHSLFWAVVTFAPLIYYTSSRWWIAGIVAVNALIHGIIDHLKCNCYKLNLNQDQILHMVQIAATYGLWRWLCI